MASLPLPTHSAAAASRGSNRRIPRATFVTPAPQLVSFGGGGLGSNSPQSSSAAASPSSSATTTIFHHHVAKMRRVLGGAVASSITRHRWRRLLNIIRFAARLRRVAQLGVKLTAFEREHLYKVYWEHSQRSGGLFDVESIARLLQEFNQPQPPTTVEQLLAHVHFRLPPTTSNSKSGSSSSGSGGRSQTPIAFYQVVQMLLHIKREHRALTQVSDEEELFLQLSSTNGGGAEHQPSADTAFHNNTNMEHTLKLHSQLEVRPVVIAPTSRVDAAAVSSILSHFDLRVAPPELFVSNSVPASPSSVSKRSSGGDHTPPPSAGHDTSSMLRYDDFQDFLQQRGVTATATGGGANDPSRRSSTASNNLTSPNGRSPVGGGRGGDDDFDEVFMLTAQQQQSTNGKFFLPSGGRSGSPPNHHVAHNSSGASSPHHLHVSSAGEPDGGGGGSSSAMVTARGSGGGSRLEELETAAEYQRLLYEGHSEQLLDMKKHVRRVERKHQAQVQAANNKMKSFEADVDRVKASGTWALQRHHQQQQQQQQTTPNASTMMGTSSIGGVGSAQRHQRGAGGSSSNNKGGTIQIVRVRPSSAIVSSTLSESAAQRLGNNNSTEAKQRSLDSGGSDRRRPMTAGPTKAPFQQQQRVSPPHHRAVSPSSHPAVQQRLSPYRQQQQSHTGGAGGAPPISPPRPTTHSRPHTAQPIIHGKQLFAQGTRQITASAQQRNNGGDDLSALSIRETTYHSHVPSIWVGSDPKSSKHAATASGDDPNLTTVSTIAGAASTAAPPSHHHHNSTPRSSAMNRIASHLSATRGQNRPMSAPLRAAAHNNASGVQSSAATVGQPSYFRPGSASSIQKKLDLYIHPTPLVELAEAPPFRLSEKQQETMGTWYANEYARLLQRPHADNRPGTAPPQTNTAAPMAAFHGVALQNNKNAANPWAFQAATCTIASSVRQTLGHSQADVVNHNRSADYHCVNVLETYVDEHYHNHRDHTHPLLSQHPHSSAAAAHHGGGPTSEHQQMPVVQHSRPVSQSDGYYHNAAGEGGAYTPAQAFADRSWLRGSSFDTAKKLKPPPSGFVS